MKTNSYRAMFALAFSLLLSAPVINAAAPAPLTPSEKKAAALFKRLIDLRSDTQLSMSCFLTNLANVVETDPRYKTMAAELRKLAKEQRIITIGNQLAALFTKLSPAAQAEWKRIRPDETKLGMVLRERLKKNGNSCKMLKDEL